MKNTSIQCMKKHAFLNTSKHYLYLYKENPHTPAKSKMATNRMYIRHDFKYWKLKYISPNKREENSTKLELIISRCRFQLSTKKYFRMKDDNRIITSTGKITCSLNIHHSELNDCGNTSGNISEACSNLNISKSWPLKSARVLQNSLWNETESSQKPVSAEHARCLGDGSVKLC